MTDHCQTYLSFPRESVILTEFPFTGNTAWSCADSGQGLSTLNDLCICLVTWTGVDASGVDKLAY